MLAREKRLPALDLNSTKVQHTIGAYSSSSAPILAARSRITANWSCTNPLA
jgi:hypothetical protein